MKVDGLEGHLDRLDRQDVRLRIASRAAAPAKKAFGPSKVCRGCPRDWRSLRRGMKRLMMLFVAVGASVAHSPGAGGGFRRGARPKRSSLRGARPLVRGISGRVA